MIVTPDDIKLVRPIADNIEDVKRIKPYIEETEILDLIPAIGADVYKQIADKSTLLGDIGGFYITSADGVKILMNKEDYSKLLEGCYFECGGCSNMYHAGLIRAVAYLSYARFIKNNSVNVTAFGVKFKNTSFSESVDERTLIRHANETQKIGEEYLRQVVEYLRCLGVLCKQKKYRKTKFKSIGR